MTGEEEKDDGCGVEERSGGASGSPFWARRRTKSRGGGQEGRRAERTCTIQSTTHRLTLRKEGRREHARTARFPCPAGQALSLYACSNRERAAVFRCDRQARKLHVMYSRKRCTHKKRNQRRGRPRTGQIQPRPSGPGRPSSPIAYEDAAEPAARPGAMVVGFCIRLSSSFLLRVVFGRVPSPRGCCSLSEGCKG